MKDAKSPENLQAPINALFKEIANAKYHEFKGIGYLGPTNGESPKVVAVKLIKFFKL